MKKVVFLYTELAEYFLACLEVVDPKELEVHVVHWPVNKEAPFEFRQLDHIHFHPRESLSDQALVEFVKDLDPDLLLTSGWVDKAYLATNQIFKGKCPTVLLLDNHWKGNLKQQLARLLSGRLIHRYFSHAWVPGGYQEQFARKLGFPKTHIETGFYCADTGLFDGFYQERLQLKSTPKRLLFIGRYLEFKGIFDLWTAFTELHAEGFSDWELWCAGSGELWEQRLEHPAIVHHGFVQPAQMKALVLGSAAFVLPSHKEPWGVVIHEMAAAGLPMVCSNTVGAATRFVEEGKNGFQHTPADAAALKAALRQIMSLTNEDRRALGAHSRRLAEDLTPTHWSRTLTSLIQS